MVARAARACVLHLGWVLTAFTPSARVASAAEVALPTRPTLGAIRWDGWFRGNSWQRNLDPRQWHHRLPFYGKEISHDKVEVHGDTQEVMDREIRYASAAGLDYWAFSALAAENRKLWKACMATGKPLVPVLNAGWDPRPRKLPGGPQPTPMELHDHVRATLDWTRGNRQAAPAQTILAYAWNETDEGGWLVPTHQEGTARLDAVRDALHETKNATTARRSLPLSNSPKPFTGEETSGNEIEGS